MAQGVFYVVRSIELNLTRDDLGHPDLPGLWDEVYPSRNLARDSLQCIQCLQEYPGCPEYMFLRIRKGKREAVHHNKNIRDHPALESDAHKALKNRIAVAAQKGGFKADIESRAGHGRRRTDVLIRGTHGFQLGCEAQISHITAGAVRKRTAIAWQDDITLLWTTNNPKAALIDLAPWARIDKMPWHDITNAAELPVRGGVRSLAIIKCERLGEICPDKKLRRRCRGWHPKWNARGISLDNLIVNAAAQLEVPLQYQPTPTSRRGYWYWVTYEDRDRYLEVTRDTPVAEPIRERGDHNGGNHEIDSKELSRVCTYGRNEWQPTSPTLRDSGVPITGPSFRLSEDSAVDGLSVHRSIARRGHCVICGISGARLYPGGWRCRDHRSKTELK